MTSVEQKAKELIDKYREHAYPPDDLVSDSEEYIECETRIAKQCAIIACDEILDVLGGSGVYGFADDKIYDFWQQVKQAIQNS